MNIKVAYFCSLANHKEWKEWLKANAEELYYDLLETLKMRSCRKNSDKMLEIYNKLYSIGLGNKLELLISSRFSNIIELESDEQSEKVIVSRSDKKKRVKTKLPSRKFTNNATNKHGVFSSYNPKILTFPHKIILTGDNLEEQVESFIRDKIGVDYIVVEDHAYIEYFLSKYGDIVDSVPRENRDIYSYRMRQKQKNG